MISSVALHMLERFLILLAMLFPIIHQMVGRVLASVTTTRTESGLMFTTHLMKTQEKWWEMGHTTSETAETWWFEFISSTSEISPRLRNSRVFQLKREKQRQRRSAAAGSSLRTTSRKSVWPKWQRRSMLLQGRVRRGKWQTVTMKRTSE